MTVVTRRQLLASGGAAVLASFALPKNLRTLLDPAPESPGALRARAGSVSKIKHVVVLMQENRSFDHYFGTMPGVRGFGDRSVSSWCSISPRRRPRTATCCPSTSTASTPPPRRCRRTATPGPTACVVEQRENGRVRLCPPRSRRRVRSVHDGLLRAAGRPVPLGRGRRVHHPGRLPLLDARPDVAEPAVPHDRHGRPERRCRRAGVLELRPVRRILAGRPTRSCSPRPASRGRSTRRSTTTG